MSLVRPGDGGSGEGHSGKQFQNPDHAEAVDNILSAFPHLRN